MKFTIERANLLKTLNHVQSVVEKRNTIPVLSNVKIEASASSLSFKATDMDIEITENVEVQGATAGVTTAPAHTLYDIVRKLPDGSQVEVEYPSETGQMVVSSGRSKFTLACLPVEDFPVMTGDDMPYNFKISSEDLKSIIDRTKFAVSTEETRYYLNGIYVHAAEDDGVKVLRAAATDGHRLACVEVPLPAGAESIPGIIVPRKTIAEIRKLADEVSGEIEVSLSANKIRFSFEGIVLTSKLIDGTYPNYEKVIPKDNDKILEIDVKELISAVERVSIIAERSRGIKVTMQAGGMVLSSSSPEAGSAVEEVEASYESDSMEIGFNYRYLLDILQEVKGDTARFCMADSSAPAVISDISDTSALYVLMPMRV